MTLTKLRECVEQNRLDQEWASSFGQKGKALERTWHEAEESMRRDPSPESVALYLKSRAKAEAECPALGGIEPQISEICNARLTTRTRPVLKDALACLIERLETERDAVIERDRASALAFGLEVHDTESPVLGRVSAALKEARGWLGRVDSMEFPQMRDPIKACIGEV